MARDADTAGADAPPTPVSGIAARMARVVALCADKVEADAQGADMAAEKVARAAGVVARSAIAVLALDAREALARKAAATPATAADVIDGATEEADMDDDLAPADFGLDPCGPGGDRDGAGALARLAALSADAPALAPRLHRLALCLGDGPPLGRAEPGGAHGPLGRMAAAGGAGAAA